MSTDAQEIIGFLDVIAHAAEKDAEATARMLENHVKASQQVIANIAALKTLEGKDGSAELLEAAGKNPT